MQNTPDDLAAAVPSHADGTFTDEQTGGRPRRELSRWARRALLAVSSLPALALIALHGVGRAEKYEGGLLGEWYVMVALTLAAAAAIAFVGWVARRTAVRG